MSRVKLVGTTSLAVLLSATALGQYSPYPPSGPSPVYQQHKSYSDYYSEQVQTYHRPPVNVRNYTIDKYFYHSPNLSPYLNLTRRTGPGNLNNYYRYVRPEEERRNQASSLPSFTPPALPTTPPPNPGHLPMTNPYFNQYYNFGGGTLGSTTPRPAPLPKLYP